MTLEKDNTKYHQKYITVDLRSDITKCLGKYKNKRYDFSSFCIFFPVYIERWHGYKKILVFRIKKLRFRLYKFNSTDSVNHNGQNTPIWSNALNIFGIILLFQVTLVISMKIRDIYRQMGKFSSGKKRFHLSKIFYRFAPMQFA